jgi:serine/threonine protein phosphatase PrpC
MEVAEAAIQSQSSHIAFAHSAIGHSHKKSQKPCQDNSLCRWESRDGDEKYTYITVADGHGGDQHFRSDLGSKFAVAAGLECMTNRAVRKALADLSLQKNGASPTLREKEREHLILKLKERIIGRWNTLVKKHYEHNSFLDSELCGISEKYAERYRENECIESAYGSTLIAVLWTDAFMLALQMGDGNCVVVNEEGEFTQPIPEDEKCFLNMTTSLCDAEAINSFRHHFSQSLPSAVIIGTDGITDSFAGAKGLYNFYRLILTSFSQSNNDSEESEKLLDYLPRLSHKGSGDDVSIAMIANRELLRNINFSVPEEAVQEQENDTPIIQEIGILPESKNHEIPDQDMNEPSSDSQVPSNAATGSHIDIVVGGM